MSKENLSAGLQVIEGINLFPELQAILVTDSSAEFHLDHDLQPEVIGNYKIAPWGRIISSLIDCLRKWKRVILSEPISDLIEM